MCYYQGILHLSRKEQIDRVYREEGYYLVWLVPFSGKFNALKMSIAISMRYQTDPDTRYAGRYGKYHILIRELKPHGWLKGD